MSVEATLVKVMVDETMIGQNAYVLTEHEKYQISGYGEYLAVILHPTIDFRSIEQNNTYWKCCEVVAEHFQDKPDWNTKEKADKQVRWAIRYINPDSVVHLTMPDGTTRLHFEFDSISFIKTNQVKANKFFNQAFQQLADFINVTVDELVKVAKERMKIKRMCVECGSTTALQTHHVFSKTYGKNGTATLYRDYIDHPDNKRVLCYDHHHNKTLEKWTEFEFCRHFKIKPRSKELLQRVEEGKINKFWEDEE